MTDLPYKTTTFSFESRPQTAPTEHNQVQNMDLLKLAHAQTFRCVVVESKQRGKALLSRLLVRVSRAEVAKDRIPSRGMECKKVLL